MAGDDDQPGQFKPGEASATTLSLAQILLAPLDALFKAQVHAARSFLNFVLQLSYPHREDLANPTQAERTLAAPDQPDTVFTVNFVQEVKVPATQPNQEPERRLQRVAVPALSLVPLRPLSIEEATFDLAMEVTWIGPHDQTRQSERDSVASDRRGPAGEDRPWYLVDDPVSLCGHVAAMPSSGDQAAAAQPHIKVNVKLSPVATPSGLDKLLTTLTQSADVTDVGPPKK